MLKYVDAVVSLAEIPDEISLCINLVGCNIHCQGCHSPWLWNTYKGEYPNNLKPKELNSEALKELITKNEGVSCIAFMGGDSDPYRVYELCKEVKLIYKLKTAWYSGRQELPDFLINSYNGQKLSRYDYIKLGPYIEEKGPLDNPNTNQKFYEVICLSKLDREYELNDITKKFWK